MKDCRWALLLTIWLVSCAGGVGTAKPTPFIVTGPTFPPPLTVTPTPRRLPARGEPFDDRAATAEAREQEWRTSQGATARAVYNREQTQEAALATYEAEKWATVEADIATAQAGPDWDWYPCPPGLPIKGNQTTTTGEWIYHIPGGEFYGRTEPEECFATEADARSAGYRRSMR